MKPTLLRPALPGLALCASLFAERACTTPYSEAPVAIQFPTSKQNKLQAGAHWDAIAKDAANLGTSLRLGKAASPPIRIATSWRCARPRRTQEFARGFQTLLTTALVNHGVQVPTA